MSDDEFERRRWSRERPRRTDTPAPPQPADETRSWRPNPQRQLQPLLWLVIAEPLEYRGTILPIEPGTVLGRQGDVRWHDPRISRRHARFDLVESAAGDWQYVVQPEHDRNGTYVNGERIQDETPLRENDQMTIGDTVFVVKVLQ